MTQATEEAATEPELRAIVPYLQLPSDDLSEAYLTALQCKDCQQAYPTEATRRACAKCSGAAEDQFSSVRLSNEGEVWVYTIVHQSYPGVPTPFVGAIIDVPVEGQPDNKVAIRANVVDVEADPSAVSMGMKVKMTARPVRKDKEGNDVVLFEYVPA